MIKLTSVRKAFQNRIALNNINYEFPRNGLCIIYGQSGSGKTTLLNFKKLPNISDLPMYSYSCR